ncbi:beta strand repeat-containing protein [Terriglobus sp. RCC_193]|uniref:beta strand repeat-containing protein n=1 Tax=Terriglobus sp. RCC_193 TaxID=3239218 RepID=UPI0035233A99
MRIALKFFSASLFALLLSGCGNSNATTSAPSNGNGSIGVGASIAVTLSASSTTTIDAGQTVALTAAVSGDSSNKGVTWSVAAGAGSVTATTALTNTYTAPTTAVTNAAVTVASVVDPTKSATVNITVNALPAFTSTGQLPQGYAGVAYAAALTSTGGTGARTYALVSGALPAGLTLNAATGVIAGTPTASGSSTFSLSVKDAAATPVTTTASFTLGISALQIVPPTLTNTVVGRTYPATTLTSAYAQGAVTYAVTAGSLPAGLTLSAAGVLSGSATTAGSNNFTITATDAAGQKATYSSTITVADTLKLSGATLPTTTANTVFAGYTLAATGGTSPYVYQIAAGSVLPAGITLSSAGVLAGTPTAPGSYNFTITALDSNGAVTATSQTASVTFALTIAVAPLTITTTSLANAVPGSPYVQTLAVTGGVAPYTFTVSAGALPAGVVLSQAGVISGRAATAGPYNFTAQVTDAEGTPQLTSQPLTLTVASALTPGVNNAMLNGSYAFVFHGVGNGALATGAASSGNVFGTDMAGSLTFDGASLVTGEIDQNNAYAGVKTAVAVTGSYSVGADQRGQIVFTYGSTTVTADLVVSSIANGVASKFRFIEADADNAIDASQVQGSGEALRQTASDFSLAALTGKYVFRLSGETAKAAIQFGALSAAGYLQFNGSGVIVRGLQDAVSYNTAYPQISLTGGYTAPDSHGRGTLTISTVGSSYPGAPIRYVYYVINAKQIAILSIDPHAGASLMAGMAYQQQQSLYSAASLSGTIIAAESAVQGGNGTTSFPNVLSATFYVLRVTGAGTLSAYKADNTAGTSETFANNPMQVSYSVSDSGRVALVNQSAPSAQMPVFWLYDNNLGVGTELENTTGPIGTLQLEGQTGSSFSTSSLSGLYATSVTPTPAPIAFASGTLNADTGTAATLVEDSTADGNIAAGVTTTLIKGVEASTGRFTLNADGVFYNGFILSPTKLVYFSVLPGFTRPVIRVAEK